jgi:Family of unknown function (DUF5947)
MRGIHNGPGTLPGSPVSPGGATGLRRFASTPTRATMAEERCELCGTELTAVGPGSPGGAGVGHAHLVDLQRRSIACACTACALLFTRPDGRYRTVPDRVRRDPGNPLTETEWAELRVPVGIAFFFINSDLGQVVAGYPSPAGVTECELDLAAWDRLAAAHPLLGALTPDVEAILIVRDQPGASGGHGTQVFLIPIDACYSLAGALRLNWHGFDGGTEVRQILAEFLDGLRKRAREI